MGKFFLGEGPDIHSEPLIQHIRRRKKKKDAVVIEKEG